MKTFKLAWRDNVKGKGFLILEAETMAHAILLAAVEPKVMMDPQQLRIDLMRGKSTKVRHYIHGRKNG